MNYLKVNIIPRTINSNFEEKIKWDTYIKDSISSLYGYVKDLNEVGLKKVLDNIFLNNIKEIQIEYSNENIESSNISNKQLVESTYKVYIESLMPANIESNKEKIEEFNSDLDKLKDESTFSEILIKYGIINNLSIWVPIDKINQVYFLAGENKYISISNESLYRKNIEDVENSPDYAPSNDNRFYSNLLSSLDVRIFSRVKKEFINITKYISNISISTTETGGNFSIIINYLNGDSIVDKETNKIYIDNNVSIKNSKKIAYMQSIFRENDLVYIKFEKLKIEEGKDEKIGNFMWDMIGLIDSTNIHNEPFSTNVTILGRDLIKLFIEDSNIFIPYQFAKSAPNFGGYTSKMVERLFVDGNYYSMIAKVNQSILSAIGFVLSQMSKIKILNSECLEKLKQEYNQGEENQINTLSKDYIFNKKNNELKLEGTEVNGIFGLIKFAVDEKIQHYKIVDSSIFSSQSSLLVYFEKIVQNPLAEMIYDTFGANYFVFARRPIFDKESIQRYVGSSKENLNKNIIIDSVLILSEDLTFSRKVYTGFQYDPKGNIIGNNLNIAFGYIPCICLDEYAEIWGNKIFQFTSNYTSIDQFSEKAKDKGTLKNMVKYNCVKDLLYIIESYAYLPFTRTGKIVIRGDRRIKRGSWIYISKTDEIFYVDSVSNSASISAEGRVTRITTLMVSRGMVLTHLHRYFSLINLKQLEADLSNYLYAINNKNDEEENDKNEKKDELPKVQIQETYVNKDNFNFLLEGYQFIQTGDYFSKEDIIASSKFEANLKNTLDYSLKI